MRDRYWLTTTTTLTCCIIQQFPTIGWRIDGTFTAVHVGTTAAPETIICSWGSWIFAGVSTSALYELEVGRRSRSFTSPQPPIPISFLWLFRGGKKNCRRNFCHGFKRFISFKAGRAGRPTHQWDHAILSPVPTRAGASARGQNSPAKLSIQEF